MRRPDEINGTTANPICYKTSNGSERYVPTIYDGQRRALLFRAVHIRFGEISHYIYSLAQSECKSNAKIVHESFHTQSLTCAPHSLPIHLTPVWTTRQIYGNFGMKYVLNIVISATSNQVLPPKHHLDDGFGLFTPKAHKTDRLNPEHTITFVYMSSSSQCWSIACATNIHQNSHHQNTADASGWSPYTGKALKRCPPHILPPTTYRQFTICVLFGICSWLWRCA